MARSRNNCQLSSNLESAASRQDDVPVDTADFDDPNTGHENAIIGTGENDPPNPEVRPAVDNMDDLAIPMSAVRLRVLGLAFAIMISCFSWVCWIALSNNVVVNKLFGYVHGLGVMITCDWAQISYDGSSLAPSWWTEGNVTIVFVFVVWILTPILCYTNVWYGSYLPMLSWMLSEDMDSTNNVTRIINADMSYSEADQLHSRAETLAARFKQGGESSDIDDAIVLDHEALERRPTGHPKRAVSLTQLAVHLCDRYDWLGEMRDVEEAIVLDREALDLRPPDHPDRSSSLHSLSRYLGRRYVQLGAPEDLDEAVVLGREALHLRPHGHPDRSMSLNNLAAYLSIRYEHHGAIEDLEEAIVLDREALHLRPPGNPYRSMSLNNLANRLWARYERHGAIEDLEDAIVLDREALHIHPPGHPDRTNSMNNLAVHLGIRYSQHGAMKDLEDAIVLDREALHLLPSGHPARSTSLNNLAIHLYTRYSQHGSIEDLEDAIIPERESLCLRPPGHPHRPLSSSNLAAHLSTRYQWYGAIEDLEDAIVLNREALHFQPSDHPDRSVLLNNLAILLCTRYEQCEVIQDLEDAIVLGREALHLRPPGHLDRSGSLNNLAGHLFARYKQHEGSEDLSEAIALGREALHLRCPGHPDRSSALSNLADYLFTLCKQRGESRDLDEAIVFAREALHLRLPGHPDRSTSLNSLAGCLSDRFRHSERLEDKEEVFSLYAQLADVTQSVSSADLSAAKSWISLAVEFQHSTLLLAYETSLRLLVQHLAILPSLPQHLVILKNLTSSLAVDGFSACLAHGHSTKAVELLEQGRGVFWSQLTRLRSPLADVIASGTAGMSLADEFSQLASLIRDALNAPGADQRDRMYHLNIEMQKVVTKIRALPDLSRFLLPPLFSDLQRATEGGPVIVVNASKYGCDALVILLDRDPVHIPLSITQQGVQDLSKELHTLTMRAKRADVSKDLALFLRKLWDQIVSSIVDFLRTTLSSQSRIWWCPTAEFSLLPLHAAAPYRKGQRSLADLYISSYTPTLTALIRARRLHPSSSSAQTKPFLAIGQAEAIGETELLCVGAELDDIGKSVDGLAKFTRIDGEESCIARVVQELGMNEWVHVACHGIPNPSQPFESAFALRDGRFTIQQIIRCELKNPEFAYLSACHTTVGDKESLDEVIHLAAAMQFAGFRSVIGTMWAVDDGETMKITSVFYKHMVDESGRLDHNRAAYALNKTMRSANIPLDQKILYIHIGA